MANFLGWKRDTIENYYALCGHDTSPPPGTINYILGYDSNKDTIRYTKPYIHKDAVCLTYPTGTPIEGTIQGGITDIIYAIDDRYPIDPIPSDLLTNQDIIDLDWFEDPQP